MTIDRWSNGTSQSFEYILFIEIISLTFLICFQHTIFRCRLNERIFFKSLIDTFGSISLLINRILFAINTVLDFIQMRNFFFLFEYSYRKDTLVNPPFFPGKHRYTPTTCTRSPGYTRREMIN